MMPLCLMGRKRSSLWEIMPLLLFHELSPHGIPPPQPLCHPTLKQSEPAHGEVNRAAVAGTFLSRLPLLPSVLNSLSTSYSIAVSQTIHPFLGTGIYSGLCPSQMFDQRGDQILWK